MIIRKLELENWRSFRGPVSAPLSPLTLLIGPNNAGKSNLVSAFHGLRALVVAAPPNLPALSEPEFALFTGASFLRIRAEVGHEDVVGNYSFEIKRAGVWTESFVSPSTNFRNSAASGAAWSGLGAPHTEPADELLRRFRTALSQFYVWRLEPNGVGNQSPVVQTARLDRSGSNAAAMLDFLKDTDMQTFEQIQSDLRRCAPEITSVTAVATQSQGHKEVVFVEKSGLRLPARHASEGIRILLFVLLIVHSPEPPPLFAIEDLEAGIHPRRIEDVVGFLRRLTQRKGGPQVIVTSHSPLVLDQFRDVPEQVIVVERGLDGTSTCISLADRLAALKGVRSDVALGDLWYSGVLGGVPAK